MMQAMKSRSKHRLLGAALMVLSLLGPVLGPANVARADSDLKNDARLEGYGGKTVALDSGPAVTYLVLFGLGVVGLSVMFKDAKRSHLD